MKTIINRRNTTIRNAYLQGASIRGIAKDFQLTKKEVKAILKPIWLRKILLYTKTAILIPPLAIITIIALILLLIVPNKDK